MLLLNEAGDIDPFKECNVNNGKRKNCEKIKSNEKPKQNCFLKLTTRYIYLQQCHSSEPSKQ